MNKLILFALCACCSLVTTAQDFDNKAWIFLTHKQEISKKWDLLADFQLRSSNNMKKLETVLLRAAASYKINKSHSIALGYAYKADWDTQPDEPSYNIEHRIYEQYIFDSKLHRTELTARVRLEQRFVEDDSRFDFSQRLRGFLSFQVPLFANHDFTRGFYTTLQNEVFLNVYNKEKVNNSLFDQNRLMGSIGYRWNSHIDTEIGYIYWHQKEMDGLANSNVFQLMITTQL